MAFQKLSRYGQTSLDGYRFPDVPPAYRARNGWLWCLAILLMLGICAATGCGLHGLITKQSVVADGLLGSATPIKAAGLVAFATLITWMLSDWMEARVERAYWRSPMGQQELAEQAGAQVVEMTSAEREIDRSAAMDERRVIGG